MTGTAAAARAGLQDFFKTKFPELAKNPFFITGESYAGVYVPTLAKEILDNAPEINLHGVAVRHTHTHTHTHTHAFFLLLLLFFLLFSFFLSSFFEIKGTAGWSHSAFQCMLTCVILLPVASCTCAYVCSKGRRPVHRQQVSS